MTYREAVEYIRGMQTGAKVKPGLAVTRRLMEHLGNPQDRLSFIHVAGTNGKGSVAACLSSIYSGVKAPADSSDPTGAGMRVGRFVSPAVFSEFEKIQYRQEGRTVFITEEELAVHLTKICLAVRRMKELGEGIPTEFEIDTAAAFLAFDSWGCDLVILETGMGGRLDSTNIVKTTVCAVITPVALDHMKFLGNTIREIAGEKAGIIKDGIPVAVCQHEPEAEAVFREVCEKRACRLALVDEGRLRIRSSNLKGSYFDYREHDGITIRMPGLYQVENACLALECTELLQTSYPVTEEELRRGLERAVWRGRFEVLRADPPVVADGAHNPDGLERFLASVCKYFAGYQKIGIMGVFADKDYKTMGRMTEPVFDQVFTITPPSDRGLPAVVLAEQIRGAVACGSIEEAAFLADRNRTDGRTAVFVFGSLSILRDACRIFGDSTFYMDFT